MRGENPYSSRSDLRCHIRYAEPIQGYWHACHVRRELQGVHRHALLQMLQLELLSILGSPEEVQITLASREQIAIIELRDSALMRVVARIQWLNETTLSS